MDTYNSLLKNGYINLFHVTFVVFLLYSLAVRDEQTPGEITKFITSKNFLLGTAVLVFAFHLYRFVVRNSVVTDLINRFWKFFEYAGTDEEYERDFVSSS